MAALRALRILGLVIERMVGRHQPVRGTMSLKEIAPLVTINAALGRCFLRLANLDSGEFERLSRYETAVWRQVNNSSSRSICCGVDDDPLGFAR